MRGIVGFRKNEFGPVIELFNIAGKGPEHMNKKAGEYAEYQGYKYYEIEYYKENKYLNKLIGMDKNGQPNILEVKSCG